MIGVLKILDILNQRSFRFPNGQLNEEILLANFQQALPAAHLLWQKRAYSSRSESVSAWQTLPGFWLDRTTDFHQTWYLGSSLHGLYNSGSEATRQLTRAPSLGVITVIHTIWSLDAWVNVMLDSSLLSNNQVDSIDWGASRKLNSLKLVWQTVNATNVSSKCH